MDCFAEPVIGRRFAPTRWLAKTGGEVHRVRDTTGRYLPTHFGGRFSENAFGPSM